MSILWQSVDKANKILKFDKVVFVRSSNNEIHIMSLITCVEQLLPLVMKYHF